MGVIIMAKKVLILLALILIVIPNISSFEWDNVKSYDSSTMTVTIRDSILGLPTTTVATIKLVDYQRLCFPGSCYAYYELDNYENDALTLKSSVYYDEKQITAKPSKVSRYEIYDETASYEIPVYEKTCKIELNKSDNKEVEVCTESIKSYETKYGKYVSFDTSTTLKSGFYKLREKIDINAGEVVDVIPNFYGVNINEWIAFEGMQIYEYNFPAVDNGDTMGTTTNESLQSFTIGTVGSNTTIILGGIQIAIAGANNNGSILFYITNATDITTCVLGEVVGWGQSPNILFPGGSYNLWYNFTMTQNATVSPGKTYCLLLISVDAGANLLVSHKRSDDYPGGAMYSNDLNAWQNWDSGFAVYGINYSAPAVINSTIIVNISDYPNGTVFNYKPVTLSFNSTAYMNNGNLTNATLYLYPPETRANYTDLPGDSNISSANLSYTFTTDGGYLWNYLYCGYKPDLTYICEFDSANQSITIDTIYPSLSINNPNASSIQLNQNNLPFNFTVSDPVGTTDSCWYNIDSGSTTSLYSICHSTGTVTSSDFFNTTNGKHTLYFYANDTANNLNSTSSTFYVFGYSFYADESLVGEGDSVTFNLSLDGVDINSEYPNSNATLLLNGVAYLPDTTDRSNQNYTYFEKTLAIPEGLGNYTGKRVTYYWIYQLRTSVPVYTSTTSSKNLTVYSMVLGDCINGNLSRVILNLSMKDEEDLTLLNATSPNEISTEIELNVTSWTNSSLSWNFHKKWLLNQTMAVCVPDGVLNSSSYKIDFIVGFKGTDHVAEFYYLDNGTLDNTNYFNSYTDNTIDLLDLKTADSDTFLFEYTDFNGLEVEDIIVHTFRKYIGDGTFREAERSKQDAEGQTHVHLVQEDVVYYFMITQYGNIIFTSTTYNAKCLSSPCQISLSASPQDTNWSLISNEGGNYGVSSNQKTRIVTVTYSLEESALVNATVYKYINNTATIINWSSSTGSSGTINIHVPLIYGNASFFVAIYKDNVFIKSVWVRLTESAKDYFGTFGVILSAFIILTIMLMAVSEGAGFIIFTVLALILVTIMQLIDLSWLALISIICAGGIIVWKLINRKGRQG